MRALVAASVCVVLTACDPGHRHGPPPEPEEKTAQVTVWDDRYEIFLEHRLIVAGTPVRFITHVTDLKSLEPRREGSVLFVMAHGDTRRDHTEKSPARAGIYIPEVTFPTAGDWKVSIQIDDHTVSLPPFRVHATKSEADGAPEPEAPEGVSFLKEQQWKVLTKAEPAARRRLVERLRLPAVLAAVPGMRALVTPPVAGRLFADQALPPLGRRVEAGQVLGYVQPPLSDLAAKLVEAEAETVRAKLTLDQAELTLDRVKRLAAEQAKSARELQEAEFAVRSAKAAYDAAVALKGAYGKSGAAIVGDVPAIAVKAPIAGTVASIGAAPGEHVEVERVLFTIVDIASLHLKVQVPQADVSRVGAAPAALLDGTPLDRPAFVGPEIDPATRAVPIVYLAPNPDGRLRPGQAVTVHLETARVEDALAIPRSAIVDEEARPIVFVQVSGETFQKRDLRLGIRDGEWVQVLSGIAEGERIVTKEAFAIRLASVSSVIPAHGHAH